MVAITKYLCCFDVTEGSYISGSWSLIVGSLRIALQVFILRSINTLTDIQKEDLPLKFSVLEALSTFRITLASGTILAALILLAGLWQLKPKWLLPWILWVILDETTNFCIMLSFIIRKVAMGNWAELTPSIFVFDGVFMFLDIYCLLCVYSCYKKIKNRKRRGKRDTWANLSNSSSELSLNLSSDDEDEPLIVPETVSRSHPI